MFLFLFIFLSVFSHPVFGSLPKQIALNDVFSGRLTNIDLNSKRSVFVFLSAKCPCSASHEKKLNDLQKVYGIKGFDFYAIHSNSDEPLQDVRNHFASSKLNFPLLQDEKARVADQFGALKTPHVFVVGNSKILYQGGVDDSNDVEYAEKEFLAEALSAISMGREPVQAKTRVLGCVIKR